MREAEGQQHDLAAVVRQPDFGPVRAGEREAGRGARRLVGAGALDFGLHRRRGGFARAQQQHRPGGEHGEGDRRGDEPAPAHSAIDAGRAARAKLSSTYFAYGTGRSSAPPATAISISSSNSRGIILRSP